MKNWVKHKVIDFCYVTDFVANGSFASLRENVSYLNAPDYAVLVRLTDFTKKWNKGFVYVSKASFDFLKKSSLFPNDLVMSNVGEPGIVFLVPDLKQPMTLGPNSILIRPNENSSTSKFIYLYFLSEKGKKQIDDISTGAAQKKFNKTSFRDLEISLPPLPEQKRIVSILDEAFEVIERSRNAAIQNLKNAKQLFESYLQSVFENKGKGWEEKKLGEVCEFTQGIQRDVKLQNEIQKENQVRFLRIVDFTQGNEPPRYIDNPDEKYILNESDISLVRYGASTGFVCRGLEGALANNLFRIIPKSKKELSNEFLFVFLISPTFQNVIKESMNGAAMPAISFGLIKDIPFPIISLKEQQTIVKKLDALSTETKKIEAIYQNKIQDLEELKKSILQKAFSGELKTSKAVAV